MTTRNAGLGRRYMGLLAGIAAVAVVVSFWGGSAMSRHDTDAKPTESAGPAIRISLRIEKNGTLTPAEVTVEKGARVAVTLVNESRAAVRVELPGYDDELQLGQIAAGDSFEGEFIADRPGDDFAWMVDGKPAGKFVVKGSHLIEGHQ